MLRTHLFNYAIAKKVIDQKKGIFIIRGDNTNRKRHTTDNLRSLVSILENDLKLEIDRHPFSSTESNQNMLQSERGDIYQSYVDILINKGLVKKKDQSQALFFDIFKYIEMYGNLMNIDDLVVGKRVVNLQTIIDREQTDFPVRRSDGTYLYHLCSPIDEHELGITHIFRGNDKLSILPYQEMIRIALEFESPNFGHLPLMIDDQGERLDLRLNEVIKDGITLPAVVSYLFSSGNGDVDKVYTDLDEALEFFDPKKIHRKDTRFDITRLTNINNKLLKAPTYTFMRPLHKYVEATGLDKGLLKKIEEDAELINLCNDLKKNPRDIYETVKLLTEPQYEDIRDLDSLWLDTSTLGEQILNSNEDGIEYNIRDMVQNADDKRKAYSALRWLLIGKIHGVDVFLISDYLIKKGQIKQRIQNSLNFLQTLNKIN